MVEPYVCGNLNQIIIIIIIIFVFNKKDFECHLENRLKDNKLILFVHL